MPRRGTLSKEQLETTQGFYPSFPGFVLEEAWPAFPLVAEFPSRSVVEDAELLWVVRARLVSRVEVVLSALRDQSEAQLAPAQASASNVRVEPVRAFAVSKAAPSAQ